MKKLIFLMSMLTGFMFVSCGNFTDTSEIEGIHVPSHVSHIEFWNGDSCIGKYDNASISLVISNTVHRSTSISKENISVTFCKYVIKCNGVEEVIINSESLAVKYIE